MPADKGSVSRKRPPTESHSSRPGYPRKRAVQACTICRRRRVKCDNDRPSCASCIQLGVQCVYQETDKSSFDAASIAILQRLDDLESIFRAVDPETLRLRDTEQSYHLLSPPKAIPQEVTVSQGVDYVSPDGPLSAESYRINIEAVLRWPLFEEAVNSQPQALASMFRSSQLDSDSSGPRLLSVSDLDIDQTGPLLQSFIKNFHIYNPVFEITQLEENIKATLYNGLGWDTRSCISLLIFALGTIALDDNDDEVPPTSMVFRHSIRFQTAESFFLAAQRRMGQLLCSSGLAEAQILFLAGVYLMATMRPFEAWRTFVQAVTCCQVLVASSADMNNDETQFHKSIFWTSFKSELELRLELGITEISPWSLRYPEFFPAPPNGLQSEGEAGWYFYLAEIALRRLSNRVLTHMCQNSSSKVSKIVEFEEQAQCWRVFPASEITPCLLEFIVNNISRLDSLPQNLRLDELTADEADVQASRLRFILKGHLVDCYEMMYWPFMADAIHGKLPENAEAMALSCKGFQMSVRRIEENEPGFRHRHHGTWLMLRSCTRSALMLIAGSRAGLNDMLPSGWKASVVKVIQLLRYWKDEVADAAFRLQLLESLL